MSYLPFSNYFLNLTSRKKLLKTKEHFEFDVLAFLFTNWYKQGYPLTRQSPNVQEIIETFNKINKELPGLYQILLKDIKHKYSDVEERIDTMAALAPSIDENDVKSISFDDFEKIFFLNYQADPLVYDILMSDSSIENLLHLFVSPEEEMMGYDSGRNIIYNYYAERLIIKNK